MDGSQAVNVIPSQPEGHHFELIFRHSTSPNGSSSLAAIHVLNMTCTMASFIKELKGRRKYDLHHINFGKISFYLKTDLG